MNVDNMKLDVPYIKQFNRYSCFPACMAMVLRYNGNKINQKQVYYKSRIMAKKKILGCWDATLILSMRDKGYLIDSWINYRNNVKMSQEAKMQFKEYNHYLKKAKKLGLIKMHKNADMVLIRRLIDKHIPVMAEVQSRAWFKSKANPEATHVIVIVGYQKGKLIVHDPAMHYHKRKGENIYVSINHFKKAWVAYPYYKNSISILSRRCVRSGPRCRVYNSCRDPVV